MADDNSKNEQDQHHPESDPSFLDIWHTSIKKLLMSNFQAFDGVHYNIPFDVEHHGYIEGTYLVGHVYLSSVQVQDAVHSGDEVRSANDSSYINEVLSEHSSSKVRINSLSCMKWFSYCPISSSLPQILSRISG